MNKIIITVFVCFIVVFSTSANAKAFEEIFESTPDKAVVSTGDSCHLSEIVNFDLNSNQAIRLPPDTDIKSIKIVSDGNEIKNKQIDEIH